jgi:hypothetical protein
MYSTPEGEFVKVPNREIFTIVGCGQSASDWKENGYSIGVNDSWKFGRPTDAILLCNAPFKFSQERLEVITKSTPKKVFAHKPGWGVWFPDWEQIVIKPWYGTVNPRQIYYSDTSPFIAISLAYTLGAKEIILWGVDFQDHHVFNSGNPQTKREVERYMELITELKELGCEVYLGSKGGVFDDKLKLYGTSVNS